MHDPTKCKVCKEKEEKTISEFEYVMKGSGLFEDFDKKRKEKNTKCS